VELRRVYPGDDENYEGIIVQSVSTTRHCRRVIQSDLESEGFQIRGTTRPPAMPVPGSLLIRTSERTTFYPN
jgi:hypothetical protein